MLNIRMNIPLRREYLDSSDEEKKKEMLQMAYMTHFFPFVWIAAELYNCHVRKVNIDLNQIRCLNDQLKAMSHKVLTRSFSSVR